MKKLRVTTCEASRPVRRICAKKGRKKVAISACGKYQLQTQLRRASCGRNCVLFAPFARIAQHVLKASVSYGWVTCCLKQTLPDPWHRMGHTCCFITLLRASRLRDPSHGHYLRSALASHVRSKDAISVHAKQVLRCVLCFKQSQGTSGLCIALPVLSFFDITDTSFLRIFGGKSIITLVIIFFKPRD